MGLDHANPLLGLSSKHISLSFFLSFCRASQQEMGTTKLISVLLLFLLISSLNATRETELNAHVKGWCFISMTLFTMERMPRMRLQLLQGHLLGPIRPFWRDQTIFVTWLCSITQSPQTIIYTPLPLGVHKAFMCMTQNKHIRLCLVFPLFSILLSTRVV